MRFSSTLLFIQQTLDNLYRGCLWEPVVVPGKSIVRLDIADSDVVAYGMVAADVAEAHLRRTEFDLIGSPVEMRDVARCITSIAWRFRPPSPST